MNLSRLLPLLMFALCLAAFAQVATTKTFSWNTRKAKDGTNWITVVATDAAGNRSTQTIHVIVSNKVARVPK